MNGYDFAYGLGVGLAAPYWLLKPSARRKVLRAFDQRMGEVPVRDPARPAVMIHAVSVGEINATRSLVQGLAESDRSLQFIVSTTTDTGFARAQQLYGDDPHVVLIRYPLDFSVAVDRLLESMRPSLVVLMELEVWPNFIQGCENRGVPVVLVNGRITTSSFRSYQWIRPVAASMFGRLTCICVQDELQGERFLALGAPPGRVTVTGTMKFDTAHVADRVEGDEQLAEAVGLPAARGSSSPVWVCGSTGPGEEKRILRQYRRLVERFAGLRLVLVPRKPERFDEVARLIEAEGFGLVRRSQSAGDRVEGSELRGQTAADRSLNPEPRTLYPSVILGDTMGELRKFYSLADVVFVGRTLVDLGPRQHGSDMIEPAALGRPVIVGPYIGNFAEAMNRFREAGAMREVRTAAELGNAVADLLAASDEAAELGRRAQRVVIEQRGATARNIEVIRSFLPALAKAKGVEAGSQ